MAKFSDYQLILDELKMTLSHVEADEFSTFASKILHAEHIFVAGKDVQDSWRIVLQCA